MSAAKRRQKMLAQSKAAEVVIDPTLKIAHNVKKGDVFLTVYDLNSA